MKTITVRMSEALDERLRASAKRSGRSKGKLILEAVEFYLAANNGSGNKSCFDLSSDLAGSLNGPNDLATDERYMEGYGR